jgi:hypothetical protein
VAPGAGERLSGTELAGLDIGATELLVGETAPTARSAGFTDDAGLVEAGVGFVTVPGEPTGEAPGVGVGEVVAVGGGRSFMSSRRSPLCVLPLCA